MLDSRKIQRPTLINIIRAILEFMEDSCHDGWVILNSIDFSNLDDDIGFENIVIEVQAVQENLNNTHGIVQCEPEKEKMDVLISEQTFINTMHTFKPFTRARPIQREVIVRAKAIVQFGSGLLLGGLAKHDFAACADHYPGLLQIASL